MTTEDIYSALKSIGCEGLFDNIIAQEGKLTGQERNELPDEAFGLPKQRKYPLKRYKNGKLEYDEIHIRQAITFFKFCPSEDRDELAKNICKALKESKMTVVVGKDTAFYPYYEKYYK